MARNNLVQLPSGGAWTELTNEENATGVVAIQNRGPHAILVLATTDGTAPTAGTDEGWSFLPGEADARSLADMYPGITTPVRLWASAPYGGAMMVSYA